ncbi:MAG: hypothetical protein KIC56_07555 [Clostridium sp.]|nr:hypothetical protein [Clostridium sp.]MEE0127700.1 hypothetical protein [Clostridia bacterium]
MNNLRALAAGNKKRFALFAIIIITIIILLITSLRLALKHETEQYKIESNITLYDSDYVPIKTEEEATINKKWDGNYYLTLNNSKSTYKLNKKVVSFNEAKSKVTLYGEVFKVLFDGQVEKYVKDTEIKNNSGDQFYKIADRQYLLISDSIRNESGSISTSKYLYVIIDKSGNTLILNNQIYAKTINPIVLTTSSYKFDIANEKLIVGSNEIDLKKIIGSSNEYKEKEPEEDTNEDKEDSKDKVEHEQNNNNNENQNSNIQNGEGTAVGNQNTQNNQNNNSNSGSNVQGGGITNSNTNKTPLSKSVSLRGAIATSSYIDIEYAVQDPEHKYQTVYAFVEAVGYENMIALDKNATTYRLTDLEPNTEYKITLGYKQITADNEIEDQIEDVLSVRTTRINAKLDITKVLAGKQKVYFNLKLDQNYAFDYAKVALYVDGMKESDLVVNLTEAVKQNGWSNVLTFENYGSEIVLQVEGTSHDGTPVSTNIQAKYRNY